MGCWSGSKSLALAISSILDPHRDSSQIFCYCSESWKSCGYGSTGLTPSRVLIAHKWGRSWGGLTRSKSWIWALVEAELISLPDLLHPCHQASFPGRGGANSAQPLGINMTSGYSPDHGHPHSFWLQHRPQISTQTPAVVGQGPRHGSWWQHG